ncbi:hypothetical protein E2C01_018135 [Portunus trituberculatus]|uniref:Uncharacterized protein n=1 Tax=Portunus trituberculatus TaxID=210409 RepID=A0A5B7DVL5_PORTR|nr:hypothetical protein [Portunus trituberculatus]
MNVSYDAILPVHVSDASGLPLIDQTIGGHQGVCQGSLAVVNVGHDAQVPNIGRVTHESRHPLGTATTTAHHHPACCCSHHSVTSTGDTAAWKGQYYATV